MYIHQPMLFAGKLYCST